jgi:hypothetical protein
MTDLASMKQYRADLRERLVGALDAGRRPTQGVECCGAATGPVFGEQAREFASEKLYFSRQPARRDDGAGAGLGTARPV